MTREDLRNRIEDECNQGFALLGPLPQTSVAVLIDYIGSLDARRRAGFLDALAERAEAMLRPTDGMLPWPEEYKRFYDFTRGPGPFSGGLRYTDIRTLAQIPRFGQFGSLQAWNLAYDGLAGTPRPDLLPDPAAFVPAKAARLKSLAKTILTPLGYTAHAIAGGGQRYVSPSGTLVDLDFGSRLAQLRCGVAIHAADKVRTPLVHLKFMSFESTLFSCDGHWNYLSEENAERCIAHLPAMIDAAAELLPGAG